VVQTATGQITGAPTEVYQGAVAQRRELRSQLERLEEQRQDLRNELRSDGNVTNAADRAGVEARIKELDGRISSVDQQLSSADAAVAQAAARMRSVSGAPVPRQQAGVTGTDERGLPAASEMRD
jgi:seryl-tRNA synthetase